MVAMMCVGCTSPDSRESSLNMDKNGKGTFSTKFGFDKSYFEQSKYGMKKSMAEYVDVFKAVMPSDLGIQFKTDTSSNSKYSYVTVSIDFDSIEDLNKKANAIMKETDKIYNNGGENESLFDFSGEIDKVYSENVVDQAFQDCLKNNEISYDVNSDQYKVIKFALATGVAIDDASAIEKVKAKVIESAINQGEATFFGSDNSEVLAITQREDGEYIEVPPYLFRLFDNYIYNVILVNRDKFINYTDTSDIIQSEMEKIVVEQIKKKFNDDKLVDYLKNEGKSNLELLSMENMRFNLYHYEICEHFNIIAEDELNELINVLANGQNNRECSDKFSVRYGDFYAEDIGEYFPILDGEFQSDIAKIKISDKDGAIGNIKEANKLANKAYDDTPKTGDRLPLEILFVLMLVSAVVTCGCFVYNKKAR